MFFDEITLSKNSWHYKLMSATFAGDPPRLWSFCPYFWLTIACMIVSPITFLVYLIGVWPIRLLFKIFESQLMEKFNNWLDKLNPGEYYELYDSWDSNLKIPKLKYTGLYERRELAMKKLCEKLGIKMYTDEGDYTPEFLAQREVWRIDYENYKIEKQKIYEIESEKNRAERIKQYERDEIRRKRIDAFLKPFEKFGDWVSSLFTVTKVVIWTKRIVSTAITLGGLYLLFILGRLWYNYASIRPVDWKLLNTLGIISGGVIAIILFVIFLVFLIKSIVTKLQSSDNRGFSNFIKSVERFFKMISPPFIVIGKFFKWLFTVIIKPFSFFILYFKSWKNDNCPAINWEE